jgi:uncharacterized protein
MRPAVKVVLDANVLLSGAFATGLCSVLIDTLVASRAWQIHLSDALLIEFHRHASGKFGAPPEKIEAFLRPILDWAVMVTPSPVAQEACRDPNDLPVLGTALSARADVLVTGDKDLLTLVSFQSIPILSPRQFNDQFLVGAS